ncbi:uncharacterized protein RCO7_14254 [Rhynchosporium graminicola]|uniref:Secreted protein n=1 Tax=Rhynchosporium graminicola TaxID=2792576 RepID=A0A1E1K3V6_9HELO|nr:uncharacterized protein RCO7_14254 [Rhynchosporium commune]
MAEHKRLCFSFRLLLCYTDFADASEIRKSCDTCTSMLPKDKKHKELVRICARTRASRPGEVPDRNLN